MSSKKTGLSSVTREELLSRPANRIWCEPLLYDLETSSWEDEHGNPVGDGVRPKRKPRTAPKKR